MRAIRANQPDGKKQEEKKGTRGRPADSSYVAAPRLSNQFLADLKPEEPHILAEENGNRTALRLFFGAPEAHTQARSAAWVCRHAREGILQPYQRSTAGRDPSGLHIND